MSLVLRGCPKLNKPSPSRSPISNPGANSSPGPNPSPIPIPDRSLALALALALAMTVQLRTSLRNFGHILMNYGNLAAFLDHYGSAAL